MASLFSISVNKLKGIGERRTKLYYKLGVFSIGDLLYFFPRTYENWMDIKTLYEAQFEKIAVVKARVISPPETRFLRENLRMFTFLASDGEGQLKVTVFNNIYAVENLKAGEEYLFRGSVIEKRPGLFEMSSPAIEPADNPPTIRPTYPQTRGLTSRAISADVKKALAMLPKEVPDTLPEALCDEYNLVSLDFAIRNIHVPSSMEDIEAARHRLIFEELLVLRLGLQKIRGRKTAEHLPIMDSSKIKCNFDKKLSEFFQLLPFSLTNAQHRVIQELLADMSKEEPMNRLVQGDVGSGKTVVAAAICYCAVKSGMQCAMMVPTSILANQHYEALSHLFSPTGIVTALLTGSTSSRERNRIYEGLATGEISFVIGTHALLSEAVQFLRLGLVITDEQHRFGVRQREALEKKGTVLHALVMSATPIPRSLALIAYGDMDISLLDELPPGRQAVRTFAVKTELREKIYGFIQKQIDKQSQVYIVCPLAEDEKDNLQSAETYTAKIGSFFPDVRIETLHGKMTDSKKEDIMIRFQQGTVDILVSTIVIEVGLDVANASVMLIENAERFGLSQLHQLRGRVGRGTGEAYCILLSDSEQEDAQRRFSILCETNDGFRIAEEDLKLRGPGDFLGSRQHGLPKMRIADLLGDIKMLEDVQQAAKELTDSGMLEDNICRGLRAEIAKELRGTQGTIVP